MKGNNSMNLNPGTMMEAIEYYLNEKIFTVGVDVKVTSITKSGGASDGFKIRFSLKEIEKGD